MSGPDRNAAIIKQYSDILRMDLLHHEGHDAHFFFRLSDNF